MTSLGQFREGARRPQRGGDVKGSVGSCGNIFREGT